MPKHMAFESIRHHLLRAIERRQDVLDATDAARLTQAALSLEVRRGASADIIVASWSEPGVAEITFPRSRFVLYKRGDVPRADSSDPYEPNVAAADTIIDEMVHLLGCRPGSPEIPRIQAESRFHDEWAHSIDPGEVRVREAFELPTAPEHQFILSAVGDLRGKKVLDLGSGLGEAAVYFAQCGAQVTACDVSPAMLALVQRVAERHGVYVDIQEAPAERTGLPDDAFDVVYAGNVLHHVDTEATLAEINRVLKPGGVLASWDPLAHNPVINVYRRLATAVRTADEHPLRMQDIHLFRRWFSDVRISCFWLTTQLVFVKFFLVDRVHPSKNRYWKRIFSHYDDISTLYRVLSRVDRIILGLMPWLGRYCWNVVVLARK